MLASALAFSVATVFTKLVTEESSINGVEISFFRFLLGFLFISGYMLAKRKSIIPNHFKYILQRTVFNTIAVMLFFTGVQYSTITNANMLNMTYPVFVFLFAPIINREQSSPLTLIYLLMTLLGAFFIIDPSFEAANYGDFFSLLSGITAGFAITTLRQARKYDSSSVILFYMMGLGCVINLMVALPSFIVPSGKPLIYILLSAATGVLGQIWLTVGYRFISAAPGSLLSASRILFAAILGIVILGEPLNARIIVGGLLIFAALTGVSGFSKFIWISYVKTRL